MNPEESGDESESSGLEEDLVPKIIDDEFFARVIQKVNTITKHFQGNQDYANAEELQRLLIISQKQKRELFTSNQKLEEMKTEVKNVNENIVNAIKMSNIDHNTISQLKNSIENAWKQADAAQEREQLMQDQFFSMRDKLERMQDEAYKTAQKKQIIEDIGPDLMKHKEGILKERDRLAAEIEDLNRRLQIQRLYTDEIERKRLQSEEKNKELFRILDDTSSEAYKERQSLDSLKEQMILVTNERNLLLEEIQTLKQQNERCVKSTVHQNLQILAAKSSLERIKTQNNLAANKLAKTQAELDQLIQLKDKVQHELNQKTYLLKAKEDEFSKARQEINKLVKSRDQTERKLQLAEIARKSIDMEVLKMKNQIINNDKEIDGLNKLIERMDKQAETVIRERDVSRKEITRLQIIIADQNSALMAKEQEIKSYKFDIKCLVLNEQKQKSYIGKMETERDKNLEEILSLKDKNDNMQNDLHLKEKYITDLKTAMNETQAKLVQMQGFFENARTELNIIQRNLLACTEERDAYKNKLLISTKQVEQLTEEISNKETELMNSQKHIEKLEKDRQQLKIELQNVQVILQNTRSELKEKKMENDHLYKSLREEELRFSKLQKDYDCAIHEKDLIGTQLLRRSDENALLNEKLEIVQMALDRGESQYSKRLDDIRLLKIEISNLRSQRNILTRGLENTADMRQEVLQLHRVLNQERIKGKALEEEMLTPMNVHRWRSLSGKDPEKMDLINKVQSLQKRILSQTVTATQREHEVQEAQKLYLSLKEFMLKLPSYKVKERLNKTQHTVGIQNKRLKALTAELNARELDDKLREVCVDELRANLETTKKELLREKKKKQKIKEERDIIVQMQTYSAPTSSCAKVLGSGFKIPVST